MKWKKTHGFPKMNVALPTAMCHSHSKILLKQLLPWNNHEMLAPINGKIEVLLAVKQNINILHHDIVNEDKLWLKHN